MKNRLSRLLKVLERCPDPVAPDVGALAAQLGATPETIRRDLRDLREAGAFDRGVARVRPANDVDPLPPAAPEPQPPANDGASAHPVALSDDDVLAMYVGARFLAAEGDASGAAVANTVLAKIGTIAGAELQTRLAETDAHYRFGPRADEGRIRQLVAQAIAERRALSIRYRGEHDEAHVAREVEPLAQFFIHDRWSFIAYCKTREDIRQFRHERCQHVRLTEKYFTPRGGFSLEAFLERRRLQARAHAAAR
jgi:predicted DNA-binding transcriptional regulator YafY